MPNQSPTLMRLLAAKTADVPQAEVTVHTTFLGGGFGRRAEVDLVRQAVTCALAMPERPVQVLWSREEDIRHDYYRPMALARWRAELDNGRRTEAGERRQAPGGAVAGRPVSRARRSACRRRASPKATPSRIRPTPFRTTSSRPWLPKAGAGRLLALGRPFAHGLLRRELRRRAGAGREEGPVRVPPRAAGRASRAISRCWRRWRRRPAGASRCRRVGPRHRACVRRSARSWRRSPRSR